VGGPATGRLAAFGMHRPGASLERRASVADVAPGVRRAGVGHGELQSELLRVRAPERRRALDGGR
jgi:hypothetical protein